MDPDQLEQEEELLANQAKHYYKDADKEKQRMNEIQRAIETTRLNGSRSIDLLRREIENNPDNIDYWNEKIQIEQTQLDQATQKMEVQLQSKSKQYEKLYSQAEQTKAKVQALTKKRRQRTSILFLADDPPGQS